MRTRRSVAKQLRRSSVAARRPTKVCPACVRDRSGKPGGRRVHKWARGGRGLGTESPARRLPSSRMDTRRPEGDAQMENDPGDPPERKGLAEVGRAGLVLKTDG